MVAADKFMTIAALEAFKTKSFEEVRIDDYLKAYQTTGKPPSAVPQTPLGEMERAAMGLPPLFHAYTPSGPSLTTTASALTLSIPNAKAPPQNIAELPLGQELIPHKVDGETYQSISCMNQYAFFSFEELRIQAYKVGQRDAPLSVKMHPFSKSGVTPSVATPSGTTLDSSEQLQSISAQPAFADHSFEELRVYSLLAGREVDSSEIKQYLGQTPSAPPPTVSITTPTPPVPPLVTPAAPSTSLFGGLGSTTQSKSTFSFKF